MLSGDKLLCKCHKPVTRHQSSSQQSYGAWYYRCYKSFQPGCCNFFKWELLPSPPPTPDMSSTRREGILPPTTPTRTRTVSYVNPDEDTPRRKAIREGLQRAYRDDNDEYTNSSSTQRISPNKRAAAPSASTRRDLFSETPSKSSPFSNGERGLIRASTESNLAGMTREQLLQLLEAKDDQLEARDDTIRALRKDNEAIRNENRLLVPRTPVSLPPSPSKGKGKESEFPTATVAHTNESPPAEQSLQSHFPARSSPSTSTKGQRTTMWN